MTERNDDTTPKENIPLKIKFSYGIGSMATAIFTGLVFANISFFYVEKLGANPILIGWAWLIFGIWNTVNDPIASYLIDNTRTSIGRRVPYIRYGSGFFGLAFIFCWFPIWTSPIGLILNFLLVLFLLDTMFTFIGCCFFALPAEIALTAQGRAELSIFTVLFGFVAVALGFIVPIFFLTGQVGIHPAFFPTMVIIGIVGSILLFISSYGVKENMFAQLQPHEPFLEGLKLTFKNKAFWIYMLPAFCMALLLPVLQIGILYYIDYIIIGKEPLFLLIALLLGVVTGFAMNLMYTEKLGPKKIMIINLTIVSIGLAILFFLGHNLVLSAIPGALIGIGLSGTMISGAVVMGDIIDNDELITGKRREGIYGGVNAIVVKYPISIANWMFLVIIVGFGFVTPKLVNGEAVKQPQTDMALMGIMLAFCLIPAILLAFSAIFMRWYPLDGPEWKEKKKSLIELHKQKEREYVKRLAEDGKLKRKKNK